MGTSLNLNNHLVSSFSHIPGLGRNLVSGALASARKDCVHVMISTISLALVEELEELHHREGLAYVAAPVFGVPAVAAKAQLNILVPGNAEATACVQPLFYAMGQKSWDLGAKTKNAH